VCSPESHKHSQRILRRQQGRSNPLTAVTSIYYRSTARYVSHGRRCATSAGGGQGETRPVALSLSSILRNRLARRLPTRPPSFPPTHPEWQDAAEVWLPGCGESTCRPPTSRAPDRHWPVREATPHRRLSTRCHDRRTGPHRSPANRSHAQRFPPALGLTMVKVWPQSDCAVAAYTMSDPGIVDGAWKPSAVVDRDWEAQRSASTLRCLS
jgi:hypothetical protein